MFTEEMIREKIKENNGKGVWIEGISNEDYHRMPGISSSDIKKVIKSTVGKWLKGKEKPMKQTPDMILGTMIHTYVLENVHFWERYFRQEEAPIAPPRNATEGKNLYKKWSEENVEVVMSYGGKLESFEWQIEYIKSFHPEFNGRMAVDPEQMKILEGIAASIKAHPVLSRLMDPAHCKSEISMFWIDPETKLLCKCRPDVNNFKWPCVLDIKSCQDGSHDAFEGDITNRHMHVSAWWYLWGSAMVFGEQYDEFIYIPCEKEEPYEVTYYPADVASLGVAEGLCKAGLIIIDRYFTSLRNGKSFNMGYSLEAKPAGVRPYALAELKEIIYNHDLQEHNLEKYLGVN